MTAESDVDQVVRNEFFPDKQRGVIVEVGAARPDYLSVSASFRSAGWKVIAVEPNPEFCAAHRAVGNEVLQYAASNVDKDDEDFFVVDSHGAPYYDGPVSYESFSSLGINGKYAELRETNHVKTSVRTIKVKVRKLDSILEHHEPKLRHIDIVAVDVEGWELNVMRGFNLSRYQPKVVILENLFDSQDYVEYMKEQGYSLWSKLPPNDIYVRDQSYILSAWQTLKRKLKLAG
ncbi:FkbM family methyltransferase [Phyllobacterium trifolii]|uniref:FkbM family methyltransferase n=1 Tax=Phyllobacterium trifolii TaxID=300193 RepID=A0A839UL70_9HYPH|nr:FkbM family methyltransferase [Phyllobacterium trifolii]MBB3149462.1 FkbM family methyltransferase [Phyllobacterium trifolii]